MGNPFCWLELTTEDLAKAREFYGKLFDWQIDPAPQMPQTYQFIQTGAEPGGGMLKTPMPGVPTAWTVYVLVEDVAAAAAQAKELGASILVEETPVKGHGWFAVIQDPQGAVLGLWQEGKQ